MAVVVPVRNILEKLAMELNKSYLDYKNLCQDKEIVEVSLSRNVNGPLSDYNFLGCPEESNTPWN